MNIRSASSNKTKIIITVVALLVLLAAIFVLEKTRVTDFIKDPTYKEAQQGPTQEQIEQDTKTQSEQKGDFLDKEQQNEDAKPAEVPEDAETIILRPAQTGEIVTIHHELQGQGYSSGSCVLTVKNGSKTTTEEAPIIYQPEYSMCAGFSIPVSTLGAGIWNIQLDVTPFDGNTLTKTINFEVAP